jgi:TolA-binding protein
MKKIRKILGRITLGLIFFAPGAALAEEAKAPAPQSLANYLEDLQTKLDHAARRANQPTSEGSAVVGLRGSKKESASKQLYWKGKQGDEPVAPEEIKAYRSAVEQARAGKNTEALASLKAFEEKYPKSVLLPDVQETRTRLSAAPQP